MGGIALRAAHTPTAFQDVSLSFRRTIAKSGRKSGMQPAAASRGPDPAASIYLCVSTYYMLSKWSGRKDLNLRPPGPEPPNEVPQNNLKR